MFKKSSTQLRFAMGVLGLLLIAGFVGITQGWESLLATAASVPLVLGLVVRETREWCDRFDRAQTFTTTPGMNGWAIKDASSAGAPTYLTSAEDGGAAVLTLAADSEAEVVTLYQNDILSFDLAKVQNVSWLAKVSGIDAVTTLVMGLASAQNDTADSVATNAWFRMQGSVSTTAVVAETDDAVTDNDDKATGASLAAVFKLFEIDFTRGLSDVRFYIDGQPVATTQTFSMSGLTAGLNVQPFVQLQKASGTGVPAVTLANFRITYNYAAGA